MPVIPPVVFSLRSLRVEGELAWVSLRDGLEISPLLTIGDEWRGCKIVSADLLKKESMRDTNQQDRKLAELLHSMSVCRLELNGIRLPALVGTTGADDANETVVFIGPARALTPPGITGAKSDDPHEATCFRYRYFVPIENIAAAKS